MDRYSKYLAISNALRNQVCELELVTRLTKDDGSIEELTHVRRAVCKKAVRQLNKMTLTFADIDRSALDRVYPFEEFTVADWPELFVDHVGWRIPKGVGSVTKVPLAWIKKTGGAWKYAGPSTTNQLVTVNAVYRGTQPGQGAVVDPSEYATATEIGASTGIELRTVNFTREQVDFQGRPYIIEADLTIVPLTSAIPGGSLQLTPANEIARILAAYGVGFDTATFVAADAADSAAGFLVTALYRGRTGIAIIQDHLAVARGWLTQTSTGAWALNQDVAKASTWQLDTAADQCSVDEYGDGDVPKRVSLYYRPRVSGLEDYTGHLERTTVGASGELKLSNPYITSHTVADKLICYWQKRLNTLRVATGRVHGMHLENGVAIDITDRLTWNGTKKFIATQVTRPADANRLQLREYDADVYVYTAGTLPADATNVYSPDYSYTMPAAPTGLTVVSQGQSADVDGKVTAYALIRATPPALNWARLMAQVKDTTTNEIYQAQLQLVGGNYEAVVAGLRPNRAHNVVAWAVNANNLDGTVSAAVNFTSADATTALGAPTVTVTQIQSREVKVELSAVADLAGQPRHRRNVLFEKVGAGSFSEVARSEERAFIRTVTHGTGYEYKARSEDQRGNESSDSSTVSITPSARIDDTYIIGQGVSGGSIADGSINRGRSSTSTGSAAGTFPFSSGGLQINMALYTFAPMVFSSGGERLRGGSSGLGNDTGTVTFEMISNTNTYDVRWRNFQP